MDMSCDWASCSRRPGLPDRPWVGGVDGGRREVLDGRLVQTPPQPRRHDRVVGNLAARVRQALPSGAQVRGDWAVSLPAGDTLVPDLMVGATVPPSALPVLPAAEVATVVEVVGADGRHVDRVWKRDLYAGAGVPCYWRVELEPWPGYRGPLPVVVVRLWEAGGWREIVAPGGRLHALPLAHTRAPDRGPEMVPVRLDPGSLTVRQATTR